MMDSPMKTRRKKKWTFPFQVKLTTKSLSERQVRTRQEAQKLLLQQKIN